MKARIGRLWRLRRRRAVEPDEEAAVTADTAQDRAPDGPGAAATSGAGTDGLALPDPARLVVAQPEQPVLLTSAGDARPVHVGELLPARRRRWPLPVLRLPSVPKRAILAAGVCAGLAAPSLARHFATRMLLGRSGSQAEGLIEITRIVYTGPLTPRAASAITKVLEAGRR
jgi:hypothetical protein